MFRMDRQSLCGWIETPVLSRSSTGEHGLTSPHNTSVGYSPPVPSLQYVGAVGIEPTTSAL